MDLPRMARPVVLALAVALGLAGCGDDDAPETSAATTTPTTAAGRVVRHVFRGGTVTGNSREQVKRGETVRLVVASDVAEEVHVHGYDERVAVPAGGTAELSFAAAIPGVFEVELEKGHRRLFTLEVQ